MSDPFQTAVVTGASRGFGRARATALAADATDFVTLLPQLTPATGLGSVAVAEYAARQGVDRDTFVEGLQPVLTPDQVAKAVVELAGDPGRVPEYLVAGAGLRPVS